MLLFATILFPNTVDDQLILDHLALPKKLNAIPMEQIWPDFALQPQEFFHFLTFTPCVFSVHPCQPVPQA